MQGLFSHYLNFFRHINESQQSGKHVYAKKEWLDDTLDGITAAGARLVYGIPTTLDSEKGRALILSELEASRYYKVRAHSGRQNHESS